MTATIKVKNVKVEKDDRIKNKLRYLWRVRPFNEIAKKFVSVRKSIEPLKGAVVITVNYAVGTGGFKIDKAIPVYVRYECKPWIFRPVFLRVF